MKLLAFLAVATVIALSPAHTHGQVTSIEPVSADPSGVLGNGDSSSPLMSMLTGVVAFRSEAKNLVPGSLDDTADIIALSNAALTQINVRSDGSEMEGSVLGPHAISGDGAIVAFNARPGAFTTEPPAAQTMCEEQALYLRNRVSGETRELALTKDGANLDGFTYATALDLSGRLMLLVSSARNISDPPVAGTNLLLYDTESGTKEVLAKLTDEQLWEEQRFRPSMSADGRFISFDACRPPDSSPTVDQDGVGVSCNCETDVFLLDRASSEVKLVSADPAGNPADESSSSPVVSADGGTVAFVSSASNLLPQNGSPQIATWRPVQVYVYHRTSGSLELASKDAKGEPANGDCSEPQLSASGSYLVFESTATNLTSPDEPQIQSTNTHVFYRRPGGSISRLDQNADGTSSFDGTSTPVISGSGLEVAFAGRAKPAEDGTDPFAQIYQAVIEGEPDNLPVQAPSMSALMRKVNAVIRSAKPFVRVHGKQVTVAMQGFSRLGISRGARARRHVMTSSAASRRVKATYEVTLTRTHSSARTLENRRSSARLSLVPGAYQVSYRVLLRQQGGGQPMTSRRSPFRRFAVGQRERSSSLDASAP